MESAEISEGLNEWEQIQSPSHQTPSSAASDGATTTDFPPVVIRDHNLRIHDGFPIFPPNNHEGLPVPSQEIQPLQDPPQESNTSSFLAVSPANEGDDVGSGGIGPRLGLYLRLLRSGIVRVAFAVRNYAVCGVSFWSFLCVAGALVVSVLYVKVRRWGRRVQRENEDRLMMLVREKDKQISQLLLQVAQMNEILSARRRVPVVRVGRLIASRPL